MFTLMDMSSSDDEDNQEAIDISIEKRNLRSTISVVDMSSDEFQMNFRMNKETFLYILNEISPHLKTTHRITAVTKETQLATTLRFLATGSYQKGIGNEIISSLSQSKVSDVISECLLAMEQVLCPKWINFKFSQEKKMEMKLKFLEKYGLPGVIGCVDGTHIKIMSPKEDLKHLYYNRKGFYSLNVMLICDFDLVITYVDSRHPGANHDAFIWSSSEADVYLKTAYLNGNSNTWLLGDGGYQCLPYLLTPYRNPSTETEKKFNIVMTKARNTIERCIGVLKNRFRCLLGERGLHYKEEKAKVMVNVCCALHNICIFFKNDWPPIEEFQEESQSLEEYVFSESDAPASTTAQNIRSNVANNLI